MGIFSTKNKFKMDALRIKERGSKDTPTNFSEQAVAFMKGMPGYYPQNHIVGHDERRPDISTITERDIKNKKVVKRDGGEYITGEIEVDGGSRPDTGGYNEVYEGFETNEAGQKVNPITGATYDTIEEFIEDAKKSDKEEGYGKQTYGVDREINYAKKWRSDFWVRGFDPGEVQEKRKQDDGYISNAARDVFRQINAQRTIRDDNGVYRGDRFNILWRAIKRAGIAEEGDYDFKDLPQSKIAKILVRDYDELILKDPDAAEEIYRIMRLGLGSNKPKTKTYTRKGSDTGYRFTDD